MSTHLREDEGLMVALALELDEDSVEELHLARGLDEHIIDGVISRRRVDGPLEEVRVVAALAQLHEDVVEAHLLARRVGEILLQQVGVHCALPLGHPSEEDELVLRRQADLYVLLEAGTMRGEKTRSHIRAAARRVQGWVCGGGVHRRQGPVGLA